MFLSKLDFVLALSIPLLTNASLKAYGGNLSYATDKAGVSVRCLLLSAGDKPSDLGVFLHSQRAARNFVQLLSTFPSNGPRSGWPFQRVHWTGDVLDLITHG